MSFSMKRFLGWTLGTAIVIPLAPLGLLVLAGHKTSPSGNGAAAWGTFALIVATVLGCAAWLILGGLIAVNPVVVACVYATICATVGFKMGALE